MKIICVLVFFLVLLTQGARFSAAYAADAKANELDIRKFSRSMAGESLESLNAKAWKCVERERYDSAAAYYSAVASRYSESLSREDKKRCAVANLNLGYVWLSWRMNAPEAYPLLMKARAIAENEGFDDIETYVMSNLGQIYFDYNNTSKSALFHREALWRIMKAGKDRYIGQNLIDYVSAAFVAEAVDTLKTDVSDMANHRFTRGVELYDYSLMLVSGLTEFSRGDTVKAAEVIERAGQKFDLSVEKDRYLSLHYLISARMWMLAGNYRNAMRQLERMVTVASEGGYVNLLEKGYAYMMECSRVLGLEREMHDYQNRAVHIRDSLFNASRFEQVKDMEMAGTLRILNENIRHAADEAEMQRQKIIWITVTCVVLLIAMVLLLIWHRRLRLAYKEIFKRNMELSSMRPQYPVDSPDKIAAKNDRPDEGGDSAPVSESRDTDTIDSRVAGEILHDVIDVMESNRDIYDPEFSVDRLAALVGKRPKQVSQAINVMAGKNFNTLLAEYRVREACRILADPENLRSGTMDGVAEKVGYKSRTYFSKVFKNLTGLTPTQFAKQSK